MEQIERKTAGRYGIASGVTANGEWVAWARLGPTVADNPIGEHAPAVWFRFGKDRAEALKNLRGELTGPSSLARVGLR